MSADFSPGEFAANVPLIASTEEDFSFLGRITDEQNQPFDLTGAVGEMFVRASSSGVIYTTLTTANGRFQIVLSDPPQPGTYRLFIEQEEMSRLLPGSYLYSLVLTFAGGKKMSIMGGTFTVRSGVTAKRFPADTFTLVDGNGACL